MDISARLTILYPCLAAAFGLLASVLSLKSLRTKRSDRGAVFLYFLSFFCLLFVLPVSLIILQEDRPLPVLRSLGLQAGDFKLGLILTAAAVPLVWASTLVSRRDPAMRLQYPFSPDACRNPRTFALYAVAYVLLYYLPWEFAFRGLLFFPLIGAVGLVPALAVQTMASTLYHLGHPHKEILAALIAGFLFGFIAHKTQSILFTTMIHGMVGVWTDAALCRLRRSTP